MTYAQLIEEVRKIAGKRYFTVSVEFDSHFHAPCCKHEPDRAETLKWSVYLSGDHKSVKSEAISCDAPTAEAVLVMVKSELRTDQVDAIAESAKVDVPAMAERS